MSDLTNRIRHALEIGRAGYARYQHLQDAFDSPESPAYWAWLNTHGIEASPELRAVFPPVPPKEIYRFSNTTDDWGYLLTAANTYETVAGILASIERPIESLGSILDFGCGPGRGVRCFFKHAETLHVAGTDVDEDAIAWCREHMPFGRFEVNGELPPSAFDENSFDATFAVSVFSHLSRRSGDAWLAELRRVLRPGGIAMLTIHGPHALGRVINEPAMFAMIEVERERFERARKIVEEDRGFGFVAQPTGHLTEDLYGVAFMHHDHVRDTWPSHGFELVDIRVGAIDDWQDAVVLRAI